MKASKHILLTIVCLLMSYVSFGQTAEPSNLSYVEKRYNIFFPINTSNVDSTFHKNSHTIQTIRQDIRNTFCADSTLQFETDSILIIATSSPDGSLEFNRNLARRRAESTSKLLQELFPELNGYKIKFKYIEENWDGLRQILMENHEFPQREEMLMIIESSMSEDAKENSLRECNEGWEHFKNKHIHALRSSSITLTFPGTRREVAFDQPLDRINELGCTTIFETPQSYISNRVSTISQTIRRKVAAVRTNLLIPFSNVGVEVCIGNSWSVGADYYFPWLNRKADHQNAMQLLGWGLEGRYWFGKERTEQDRLTGHSVGLSSYAGYYDFERHYSGIQGEFINVGLDYLYALPVCKNRLHLEFTLGLGYIYSNVKPYDVFKEGGKAFKEGYTKKFNWVGPVKAGISLVVPIYATRK